MPSVKDKKIEILILAYYFNPDKRVGAFRATYWANNLPQLFDCNVSVITATPQDLDSCAHFVRPKAFHWLSYVIKDAGIKWIQNVKMFLIQKPEISPDVVIISGGPFMHFDLTNWFQKKLGSKVILDYRDPFVNNPVFNNSWFKTFVKSFYERRFNKNADALITVNKYCTRLIQYFDDKPNAIIQNGFDETIEIQPEKVNLGAAMRFVYAGKLYLSPELFVKAVENSEHSFTYIGPDEAMLKANTKRVTSLGFLPYDKAINEVNKADVGILLTVGKDFLSTTKIFDYIRCNKVILIISELPSKKGSIYDELKDYPNVFWCKNEINSIKECIGAIEKHVFIEPKFGYAMKYSRKVQAKKLVELIKKISEN